MPFKLLIEVLKFINQYKWRLPVQTFLILQQNTAGAPYLETNMVSQSCLLFLNSGACVNGILNFHPYLHRDQDRA